MTASKQVDKKTMIHPDLTYSNIIHPYALWRFSKDALAVFQPPRKLCMAAIGERHECSIISEVLGASAPISDRPKTCHGANSHVPTKFHCDLFKQFWDSSLQVAKNQLRYFFHLSSQVFVAFLQIFHLPEMGRILRAGHFRSGNGLRHQELWPRCSLAVHHSHFEDLDT